MTSYESCSESRRFTNSDARNFTVAIFRDGGLRKPWQGGSSSEFGARRAGKSATVGNCGGSDSTMFARDKKGLQLALQLAFINAGHLVRESGGLRKLCITSVFVCLV